MLTVFPGVHFSMELSERGTNRIKFQRQNTHVVAFHETKQKLFRFARAKDKRVVDLRKELKSLTKEEKPSTKEEKIRHDDLIKELESLTKDEKTKLDDLKLEFESLPKEEQKKLSQETDDRLNTALHYAAKAGNLDACKLLGEKGANINALGQNKMTPLQFAARYGDQGRGRG